ncbi:MAG: hypothetical protein ACTH31_11040 [Pseudoclavibacter sp.]
MPNRVPERLPRRRFLSGRRLLTLAFLSAAAFAITGCADGDASAANSSPTEVAVPPPATGAPTSRPSDPPASTGYVEIDAIQAALGGAWKMLTHYPHGACETTDGPEPGSGMQNVARTESSAQRSPATAAENAAAALDGTGFVAGPIDRDDASAGFTASNEAGSTMTVTIETARATIEHRTPCR